MTIEYTDKFKTFKVNLLGEQLKVRDYLNVELGFYVSFVQYNSTFKKIPMIVENSGFVYSAMVTFYKQTNLIFIIKLIFINFNFILKGRLKSQRLKASGFNLPLPSK